MLLRTLTGRYAGEIRDYDMSVGRLALMSGTAERVTQATGVEPRSVVAIAPDAVSVTDQPRRELFSKRHRR